MPYTLRIRRPNFRGNLRNPRLVNLQDDRFLPFFGGATEWKHQKKTHGIRWGLLSNNLQRPSQAPPEVQYNPQWDPNSKPPRVMQLVQSKQSQMPQQVPAVHSVGMQILCLGPWSVMLDVFLIWIFLKRGSDFSELGGWTQTPEKGILLELEASGVVRSGCLEVAEAPAPQFNEPPVAFLGIWEAKGLFISRLRFAAGTYICKYWVLTPTWIPDHLPFGLRYYVPPYLLPFFRDFHIMGSSEMENQLSTGWINSWVTRISMKWSKPLWIWVSSQFSWLQLPDRVK